MLEYAYANLPLALLGALQNLVALAFFSDVLLLTFVLYHLPARPRPMKNRFLRRAVFTLQVLASFASIMVEKTMPTVALIFGLVLLYLFALPHEQAQASSQEKASE